MAIRGTTVDVTISVYDINGALFAPSTTALEFATGDDTGFRPFAGTVSNPTLGVYRATLPAGNGPLLEWLFTFTDASGRIGKVYGSTPVTDPKAPA